MGRNAEDYLFVKDANKKDVAAKYLKDTICNLRKAINNDF